MLQKIDGGTKVRQASNVLASNVEEMKEFLKAALDRLETTDFKEEGAGGKKKKGRDLQLFSKGGHKPTDGRFKRCVYANKG